MWTVGWDHLFSKTTLVYVTYAKTDNGTNAAFTVNAAHSDVSRPRTTHVRRPNSMSRLRTFTRTSARPETPTLKHRHRK